jgi:hypothetical protein
MRWRPRIWSLVGGVTSEGSSLVLVFAIGIWLADDRLDPGWLRFYSLAVLLATVGVWLWESALWKLPVVQRSGKVPRNVGGTWKGTLDSFWIDPNTGQRPGPKPAYLVVRQTATAVSVILLTDESKSVPSQGVVSSGPGVASLDYMYLNRPDPSVENRSRMHHGSASLDITGLPPTRLRGRYWTDRDTRGELDFGERRKQKAEDFDQARNLFG